MHEGYFSIGNCYEYKKFKNDGNKKYTSLLCKVKDKLKKLYESYGYEFNMSFLSNLEKGVVSFSSHDLIMIKDLCLEYIYLRNKLIEGNLSLVPAMARPYFNEDNNRLEMIQNGNDGLMTAVFKLASGIAPVSKLLDKAIEQFLEPTKN